VTTVGARGADFFPSSQNLLGWPAVRRRRRRCSRSLDAANRRSIAIPKSAQLLLIERSNERAKIEQRGLGLFG
jgi:hypothetical protein